VEKMSWEKHESYKNQNTGRGRFFERQKKKVPTAAREHR